MAHPKAPHILIVDDDRSTQRVLAEALKNEGFSVTVERDGEWAVQAFETKRFDAVILDLLLPAIAGYDVAQQMRAMPKARSTPIIFISGVYKTALQQKEAVTKHGAFAFLEKPVDLELLRETLKSALGTSYPEEETGVDHRPVPPPLEEDSITGENLADDAQREEAQDVENHPASKTLELARGDFAKQPFAEVLAELHRDRVTGALLLKREKVKKIVYFRDGLPELVKSNLLIECLGRILVREKMISEAECAESLRRMKSSKRMQGTVLIEMGCLSPHNLQYALSMQLQEKLFDAFRWEVGDYQLNTGTPPPPEPLQLGMNVAQLILQGVKRTYDEVRLATVMAGLDQFYVHPSEDPLIALQDAALGDEERELVQLIDGHKTVATLRALEVLSPLETGQLIFALKCSQMVELKSDPAPGKPRLSIVNMAALGAMASTALPPPLPLSPRISAPPPLPGRNIVSMSTPLGQGVTSAEPQPPPPPPDLTPPPIVVVSPAAHGWSQPAITLASGPLLPELPELITGPRLSNAETFLRESLAGKLAAMRRLDYFGVLNVQKSSSREDVKRSYFGLAKDFHPDKFTETNSPELKALAQQLYDLVSLAHDTLASPALKAQYLADLSKGVKPDFGEDAGKILSAEGKFQRGEEMMRQQNYPAAIKSFREAIELYPSEGEFHAWLGWAIFHRDANEVDQALKVIEEGITLSPKLDKSYLFLGYILKASGRPDKASKQFEKAIQCNPDCTEALRELRLSGAKPKR